MKEKSVITRDGEGMELERAAQPGAMPTVITEKPSKVVMNGRARSRSSNISVVGSRQGTKTSMEAMENVFQGRLTDLPPIPTNTVKVYICSTQSDFKYEREKLWVETLPDLQHEFLAQGLDIEFVDVHQAPDLDHATDRHALDRHIAEIRAAHKTSTGPFFLGLIGNKYGPVPLPAFLEEGEFNHIRNEAFEGGKDVKLLDEWYIRDENCIPPVYTLRPITDKYDHTNATCLASVTTEHAQLLPRRHVSKPRKKALVTDNVTRHDRDVQDWLTTYESLKDLLQHAATVCHKEGKINQVHQHKQSRYFTSAVEQEVGEALKLSTQNCFVVMRTLEGIPTDHKQSTKYTDIKTPNQLHSAAQERLQNMKEDIASKLNEKNMQSFYVPWKDGFRPMEHEEHLTYLESFHEVVYDWLQERINQQIKDNPMYKGYFTDEKQLYYELLSQYNSYKRYTRSTLYGLEETEERLKKTLATGSKGEHHMVLLYGAEGSGKSCVLSHFCKSAVDMLGKESILILRYIGISDMICTVWELLRSICTQLSHTLRKDCSLKEKSEEELILNFQDLLITLGKESDLSVLIVVDGIENLKPSIHGSRINIDWLVGKLPKNVHVYGSFSLTSSNNDLFQRMKLKIAQKDLLIETSTLDRQAVGDIAKESLSSVKRSLTKEQENLILKATKETGNPFLLNILLHEARGWSSSWQASGSLPTSVEDIIERRFEQLEKNHGQALMGHISRYITSAYYGLSEVELVDLLSSNNDVMLMTYLTEMPKLLRFPHSLWQQIRIGLGPLLEETFVDLKTLLCWSHNCITNVVIKRYFSKVDEIKQSHRDIADLLVETWIENKPMVVPQRNLQIIDHGIRFTGLQPLLYSETKYNMRRLSELWYQLLHSGDIDTFKEFAFCNFEYLLAKIHSTSVHCLVADLQSTIGQVLDAELFLILRCIKQAVETLAHNPLQLASELIGRLRQVKEYYPLHIESLIQQCMEWCDSYCLPILVPLSSWLPDPRVPAILSIDCHHSVTHICPTQNGQHLFCASDKNDINMYHVPSKKRLKTLTGHKGPVTCLNVSHNSKFLLTGSADKSLRVWDIASGKNTQVIKEHNDEILCLVLTRNDQTVITGSKDKTFKVISLDTGKVVVTQEAHDGAIIAMELNSLDTILATASEDKTIKLWDMDDWEVLNTLDGLECAITAMSVSHDNTFLLVGLDDISLHVRSFTTGSEIHTLEGHKGKVLSIAISTDCFHAVIGCSDHNVYIYNLRSQELLDTFSGHTHAVTSVKISKDEHFIYSTAKGVETHLLFQDKINVWTFYKRHTRDVHTDEHNDQVTCIAITKDKTAITGSKDHTCKLWNLDICDFTADLIGHEAPITCVALSNDEAFALSGSEDCTVKVWSVMLAVVITDYMEHSSCITSVQVMSDNQWVMTAEQQGTIKIWRAENGTTHFSIAGPTKILHLAPNAHLAISGDGDEKLRIWQVKDGEVVGQVMSHADEITCVSYSADSQYVATGSLDMSLKVWEAATGKLTQVLVEHEGPVKCAAITDGNRHVLSGSDDTKLLIWNLSTGLVEHRLNGHTGPVTAVKTTSDGGIAISGSEDMCLRVWSVIHGTLITLFNMHVPVLDLRITSNGAHVVVKVADSAHVPLMCLHNSPAGEIKSQSQINIQVPGESPVLPIKPRAPLLHRLSTSFPVPRRRLNRDRASVSTIPEIIKVQMSPTRAIKKKTKPNKEPDVQISPVRTSTAPLKEVVKRQETNKEHREQKLKENSSVIERVKPQGEEKKSSVCSIL